MAPFAPFFLSALAVLVPLARGQARTKPITELFDVNLENNDNGGCAYVGVDNLNSMVLDAYRAASGVRDMMGNLDEFPPGQELVEAFFNEKDPSRTLPRANRVTIRTRYTGVRDWLRDGGNVDGGENSVKPMLFCDSNFLTRKAMADDAFDTDGNLVKNGEGNVMQIQEIEKHRRGRARRAAKLSTDKKKMPLSRIFPYWNAIFKRYEFDTKHHETDLTGPCSSGQVWGYTNSAAQVPYMVLCPRVFGLTGSTKDSPWGYRPMMLAESDRPTGGQVSTIARIERQDHAGIFLLKDVAPTAHTFLHELFHLVHGDEGAYPADRDEVYKMDTILQVGFDVASRNPESYALMAVALFNTVHPDPDATDRTTLYWKTGYATTD